MPKLDRGASRDGPNVEDGPRITPAAGGRRAPRYKGRGVGPPTRAGLFCPHPMREREAAHLIIPLVRSPEARRSQSIASTPAHTHTRPGAGTRTRDRRRGDGGMPGLCRIAPSSTRGIDAAQINRQICRMVRLICRLLHGGSSAAGGFHAEDVVIPWFPSS